MKKKDNTPLYIMLSGALPFIIPILAGIYKVTFESSFLIKIYLLILTKRRENSYVYSIKS